MIDPRTALLQSLTFGDGYGLELIKRLKERTAGKVVLGQGSTYPALRSLEREGLAESYEGEPLAERGGRPRVYYRLTEKGRRAAAECRKAILGLLR